MTLQTDKQTDKQMEKEADKEKWSNLLCQTISAMCKRSIIGQEIVEQKIRSLFKVCGTEFVCRIKSVHQTKFEVLRVQGLVGITLCNNEVFLVDVSEHFELDAFTNDQQSPAAKKTKNSNPKAYMIEEFNDANEGDANENGNIQIISPKCDGGQDNWDHINNQPLNNTNHFSNNQQYRNNFSNNSSQQQQYNINNFKTPDLPPPPSQFDSLNQLQTFTTKEISPPVKRTRAKKEFSRTLATTKHTAEILSYQDFTPFSSRPYTCKLCDACFSKRFCLANHIVTVHQVGGKYVCEMCSRQFLQRNRYMLHIEKHSNEGSRLVCPECGKNFTIRNNYQHHLSICTGYNNYKNKNNNASGNNNKNNIVVHNSNNNNRNNNNNNNSVSNNNSSLPTSASSSNNNTKVKMEESKGDSTLTFDSFDDVMNDGGVGMVDGGVGIDGGGEEIELIDNTPIKQEDLLMFGIQN